MQTRQITLATGRSLAFEVAATAQPDAYFVLGIRKCGSSLLNSMLTDLGRLNGHPFVDVGGGFFAADVPEQDWRHDPAVLRALAGGTVYGGFRSMPLVFAQSPLYLRSRKILLVRDPRDALVSEYYSIARRLSGVRRRGRRPAHPRLPLRGGDPGQAALAAQHGRAFRLGVRLAGLRGRHDGVGGPGAVGGTQPGVHPARGAG